MVILILPPTPQQHTISCTCIYETREFERYTIHYKVTIYFYYIELPLFTFTAYEQQSLDVKRNRVLTISLSISLTNAI